MYIDKARRSLDDTVGKRHKDLASKLMKQNNKLKMVAFKDAVLTEMGEFFYNPSFMRRLDDAPNLLCFTNGVYDLDYLTKNTGYAYTDEADDGITAEIMIFLRSIMATEAMSEYLLKTLAYMLHGTKYLEQFWFWTGRGRNGKGTLCTLLSKTLGEDYYYEPDITIVTAVKKSSSNANPELAKAKGKRLLVATEPDDADRDTKFRVNRLKQLRGNDLIQARGLYKDCEEYRPQFGMIFQMNDIPELSKVDDAIAKSLKIVEFPYQFVERPQFDYQRQLDASLKMKFERDVRYHQQFMMLLLKIHKESIQGNKMLSEPEEVIQATSQYITENNPVSRWLSEAYTITNNMNDRVTSEELYRSFMEDNPEQRSVSKKKFGSYMGLLGFKSLVSNGSRYFRGIEKKCVIDNDY
jgi:putative DNA primase/helicase